MRNYKNKTTKDSLLTDTGETLRINMIGRYLRDHFGHKVVKLSLDGGFTCPNRDGTLGTGGCLFCGSNRSEHPDNSKPDVNGTDADNDSQNDFIHAVYDSAVHHGSDHSRSADRIRE